MRISHSVLKEVFTISPHRQFFIRRNMYPHFIEVHDIEDEQDVISINIDNICNFHVDNDGMTVIRTIGNIYYFVAETYDEVKQLIESSGCLIQKGDPRLDTTHPLTMADLKDLVRQPVWDSNRNIWYLFKSFDDDGQAHFTDVFGNTAIAESEDALKKYPLYRMKVAQ